MATAKYYRDFDTVTTIEQTGQPLTSTKLTLERLGYSVTVRTNSLEALTTFQKDPEGFDLIVTDQTMPGLTGSDLARRILQIRSDIPIILCTGYSNLIDEDSAKALGIKEFALKPLTMGGIAKLIRKALKRDSGERAESHRSSGG